VGDRRGGRIHGYASGCSPSSAGDVHRHRIPEADRQFCGRCPEGRSDDESPLSALPERVRLLIVRDVRVRHTSRLHLEPVGSWHAGDLWYAGRWSREEAARGAAAMGAASSCIRGLVEGHDAASFALYVARGQAAEGR
jgi:hypothetical protein